MLILLLLDGTSILTDKQRRTHYDNQSLLWYPKLLNATDDERNQYRFGFDGIHWRNLDEDISFESFGYEDAEPSRLQKFFLTHKELDIDEFAKRAGLDATQLKNYINGFKRPSEESEQQIVNSIHAIGREYIRAQAYQSVQWGGSPIFAHYQG